MLLKLKLVLKIKRVKKLLLNIMHYIKKLSGNSDYLNIISKLQHHTCPMTSFAQVVGL